MIIMAKQISNQAYKTGVIQRVPRGKRAGIILADDGTVHEFTSNSLNLNLGVAVRFKATRTGPARGIEVSKRSHSTLSRFRGLA